MANQRVICQICQSFTPPTFPTLRYQMLFSHQFNHNIIIMIVRLLEWHIKKERRDQSQINQSNKSNVTREKETTCQHFKLANMITINRNASKIYNIFPFFGTKTFCLTFYLAMMVTVKPSKLLGNGGKWFLPSYLSMTSSF